MARDPRVLLDRPRPAFELGHGVRPLLASDRADDDRAGGDRLERAPRTDRDSDTSTDRYRRIHCARGMASSGPHPIRGGADHSRSTDRDGAVDRAERRSGDVDRDRGGRTAHRCEGPCGLSRRHLGPIHAGRTAARWSPLPREHRAREDAPVDGARVAPSPQGRSHRALSRSVAFGRVCDLRSSSGRLRAARCTTRRPGRPLHRGVAHHGSRTGTEPGEWLALALAGTGVAGNRRLEGSRGVRARRAAAA